MKLNILLFVAFVSFTIKALGQAAPVVVLTPENPYSHAKTINIAPEDVLKNLRTEHPRLILTRTRIEELRKRSETDSILRKYINSVIEQADEQIMAKAAVGHRAVLSRELLFGLAYHFTKDKKYYKPFLKDMLMLCNERDWGWVHFLDPAESTLTVAIGYDWFYDCIPDTTRIFIKNRLINNGLIPGLAAYAGAPFGWFRYVRHNWNQVCNSGLLIGALAIAETDPDYAKLIIPKAVASEPLALNEYAPDGAYPEGTGYWGFGTPFSVYGFSALKSALGTDFGLSNFEPLHQTYYFSLYTRGPSGLQLGYADQSPKAPRYPTDGFFWAADRYNDSYLSDNEHEFLRQSHKRPTPFHVLFYRPISDKVTTDIPLDRYFNGPVPVATMRSSWTNINATFAAIKGGYNQVNHGHLDLGNFEFDMLGERWAYDIGSDHYELKGYFVMDSTRWSYYRTSSFSHNVPTVNGNNQNIKANARIIKTSLNKDTPFAIVDLTEAYQESCSSVKRGIKLLNNRINLLVQDEYDFKNPYTLTWGFSTDASIKINRQSAELKQNGKVIYVKILEPQNATFVTTVAPALSNDEKSTAGIHRLSINIKGSNAKQTLRVLFSPKPIESVHELKSERLDSWK